MTTKTDEQEREAFERHWYNFYHMGAIKARSDGRYHHPAVQTAWDAWQARAALQPQHREDALVQAIQEAIALLGPEAPSCSGCEYEWNHALRVLHEAIDHARRNEGQK